MPRPGMSQTRVSPHIPQSGTALHAAPPHLVVRPYEVGPAFLELDPDAPGPAGLLRSAGREAAYS